ncbi:MAG: MarR family transcriptional regulator [Pseudomonadota bacterium]
MSDQQRTEELARYVNLIIRALLVAGRSGAPAEGRIPFNPLYFNMLRSISAEGAVRPSHLADILSVPRSTVSTAVKSLEKRGLVFTSPDKTDRRALCVSLTEEGADVLEAILRQDMRNSGAMLSALHEEEKDLFVAMVGRVAKGVSGPSDDAEPNPSQ